jgi:predicted ATP-grasp superfamily ATP-dependent carboligase
MNALVTNARSASALAVIRSLGRKGIEVTGVSDSRDDFPLYSKYCSKKILLRTDPNETEKRLDELLDIVKNNEFDVFLPLMSENSLLELARRKGDFEKYTRLALPSFDQLSILNNKAKVSSMLAELGMPRPETFLMEPGSAPESIVKNTGFPLIIKPFRGEGAKGVKIINDLNELENSYSEITKNHGPALIQKFIPGIKHTAVFLLNKDSEVRRFFVHRAIREFPVTGGPTCFLESVRYEPIYEIGLKLLKRANFTGLAAMEFIIDSTDGLPKIIDVNPRFYGPLQCAISAGVDLPYAVYNMAVKGDIEPDFSYKEGITCRYLLFEDTKHLISILKGVKSPKHRYGKVATLINYLNFFHDDSYFVLSFTDPLPALKKIFKWL